MSHTVLKDAKLWFDGLDLSGDISAMALTYGCELKDDTTFGSGGARSRQPGLKNVDLQHEGFWNPGVGGIDELLFAKIGATHKPMSIGPLTGAEGELGFTFNALTGLYEPGSEVGGMLRFSVSGSGVGDLIRGTVMHNASRSSSASGTARQLGVVSSTQKVYAALHVLSVSGTSPTLVVKVQRDNASGFPSATDVITFASANAIGSQWATPVAGPLTDDWWRINWTIGGTASPTFSFVVVVGIQ